MCRLNHSILRIATHEISVTQRRRAEKTHPHSRRTRRSTCALNAKCKRENSMRRSMISISRRIQFITVRLFPVQSHSSTKLTPSLRYSGFGALGGKTLLPDAVHSNGILEIDAHNLWGLMEEQATYTALLDILPGKRPFLISRSTFPSSGKWSGHWVSCIFCESERRSLLPTQSRVDFDADVPDRCSSLCSLETTIVYGAICT